MKLTKSNLAQDVDPRLDVAEVEGIVEATHLISTHLCNLGHLCELLRVAGNEVEEREAVKVLGALVGDLDDLFEGAGCQRAVESEEERRKNEPCGYPA